MRGGVWVMYGVERSNGWCCIFMGKIRHASYNSRSSGFTTTISNLLLLFHSNIYSVYQIYRKQLCKPKRLVNINVVLEKCSRWKFAEHDEQQYDDHQGKVASIDLEFSRSPKFKASSLHRADQAQEQWSSNTYKRAYFACVWKYSSDERTESLKQQVSFALTAAHLNLCSPVTILVIKSSRYR